MPASESNTKWEEEREQLLDLILDLETDNDRLLAELQDALDELDQLRESVGLLYDE